MKELYCVVSKEVILVGATDKFWHHEVDHGLSVLVSFARCQIWKTFEDLKRTNEVPIGREFADIEKFTLGNNFHAIEYDEVIRQFNEYKNSKHEK